MQPNTNRTYNKYHSPTNRQVNLTPPYKVYSRASSKQFQRAIGELLRTILGQLTKAVVALIRGK